MFSYRLGFFARLASMDSLANFGYFISDLDDLALKRIQFFQELTAFFLVRFWFAELLFYSLAQLPGSHQEMPVGNREH